MVYVEWLRVRRALAIFGVVLVTIIIIGGIGRLTIGNAVHQSRHIGLTSHSLIIRDGNKTTYLNQRAGKRTVIVLNKNQEMTSFLVSPLTAADKRALRAASASHSKQSNANDHNSGPVNVLVLFNIAAFIVAIFATVLAAPLAKENDHLEVAWTKPIDRTRLASKIFGADIIALLCALGMTMFTELIVIATWAVPHFEFKSDQWLILATVLVAPIAWYALLVCGTASIRGRGYGVIIGGAWALSFGIPGGVAFFGSMPMRDTTIGAILLPVLDTLSKLDPIIYLSMSHGGVDFGTAARHLTNAGANIFIVVGLVALYLAGAILQWRRLEA